MKSAKQAREESNNNSEKLIEEEWIDLVFKIQKAIDDGRFYIKIEDAYLENRKKLIELGYDIYVNPGDKLTISWLNS